VFKAKSVVYRVVVLPEPVGQVTRIRPFFLLIAFSIILFDVQKNHNSLKSIIAFDVSSILETIFSQYFVGNVEILTHIFLFSN